jgi:hypothetical protein
MGAGVQNIVASRNRTFVLYAKTERGLMITRDGGLSWRTAGENDAPEFPAFNFSTWTNAPNGWSLRVDEAGALVRSRDGGKTSSPCMKGWRIPRSVSVFVTRWGIIASGPGGCYRSDDGEKWIELKLWREEETGAADFLHAYWMGRYYGFIRPTD